jgi:hypothetical protein
MSIGRTSFSQLVMILFHPLNSLIVTRNLWQILLINLFKHNSNNFFKYQDSKSALISSLASVVAELLAIL